jgi:hypothetical protein
MDIPKKIAIPIGLIVLIALVSILLDFHFCSNRFTAGGQFIVLSMTLIVLIVYAWDTHRIANTTEKKWEEDLKPKLLYEMVMNPKDPSDCRFRLINTTDYLIEAKVNCNMKVYGEPVSFSGAYDGSETWLIFPHQISEGHFSIDTVLSKKGKTRSEMILSATPENQSEQLTMDLEISFKSETGREREYPLRRHYFLVKQGVWVPELIAKNSV